jgi:hypothetical protein
MEQLQTVKADAMRSGPIFTLLVVILLLLQRQSNSQTIFDAQSTQGRTSTSELFLPYQHDPANQSLAPGYSLHPQGSHFAESTKTIQPANRRPQSHRSFSGQVAQGTTMAPIHGTAPVHGMAPVHGTAPGIPAVDWELATDFGAILRNDPIYADLQEHRTSVFGDFLFLTARDVDIAFATQVDGPVANAAPLASASIVNPDHEGGIRVGGRWALDAGTSLTATYWHFLSEAGNSLMLPANTGWIRSEVSHPSTLAIAPDSLIASADDEISFQMVDLMIESLVCGQRDFAIDVLFGLRYAQLNEQFRSAFAINGTTMVDSEIDFNGLGFRMGLEGKRRLDCGLLVYGQAFGNLLMGEFSADYTQRNALAGVQATTAIDDEFRFVPQLEFELGVGWQSSSGRLRLRAGYYIGTWFNVATSSEWIDAVQRNNISDVKGALLFDGMTMRAEYRF